MAVNRWLRRMLLGSICTLAAACVSGPPIAIQGSPSSLQALVGEWDGTYTSRDTGRSGSIWFKLIAGEDHAHGDVLMTPKGWTHSYYRYRPHSRPSVNHPADLTQALTIQFVHTADGTIDGHLEPYWDPDCQCEAVTTFRGRLQGDRLEGTFSTRLGIAGQANGRWIAYRRRLALLSSREGRH
jgi:hypothetical protein